MRDPQAKTTLPKPHSKIHLGDLGDLSRDQLASMWQRAHGCPPPKGVRRGLLERSAAWHIQAKSSAHLVTMVRRQLRERMPKAVQTVASAACDRATVEGQPVPRGSPPLGTRLVREWNGRTYAVDVTVEGFVLNGKMYRSLTAVARKITGTHWSGPRFFGL